VKTTRLSLAAVLTLLCSCATSSAPSAPSADGEKGAADEALPRVVRGGRLYDNWARVAHITPPTADNPLWATRPDKTSTFAGADTWRCKECHGWDYKGADGVYGTGRHRTGFKGIFGTTLSDAQIVDSLRGRHGYGAAGLGEADLQALAEFARTGLVDSNDFIDDRKHFKGDAAKGKEVYTANCEKCHDANGLNDKPKSSRGNFDAFPGRIAQSGPAEFIHKVRFGKPGKEMPFQHGKLQPADLANLGAYTATLPRGREGAAAPTP
jgi:thiosulfate dehydrogenase